MEADGTPRGDGDHTGPGGVWLGAHHIVSVVVPFQVSFDRRDWGARKKFRDTGALQPHGSRVAFLQGSLRPPWGT